MNDCIMIKGLSLFAYHGVNDEEKRNGQVFLIDIVLHCDLKKPSRSDNLEDTVNYAQALKAARAAFLLDRYDLIERAAGAIADKMLELFEQVTAVEVTVEKPEAPISARFDYVAVRVCRSRSETGEAQRGMQCGAAE